jgi:hypothetical protein
MNFIKLCLIVVLCIPFMGCTVHVVEDPCICRQPRVIYRPVYIQRPVAHRRHPQPRYHTARPVRRRPRPR